MIDDILSPVRLLLGLASLMALGYGPVAFLGAQAPESPLTERLALSFGVGAVLATLGMLGLSSIGIPFSLPVILIPLLGVSGAALLSNRVRNTVAADLASLISKPKLSLRGWEWLWLALLAALFLFASLRATLYPLWAWDALATWGFKGKVFYLRRALNFTGFEAHNYYPNLLPLLLTYLYLWLGQVNDRLVNGLFPFWGALLLLLFYRLLRRLHLTRPAALGLTAFLALNGATFIDHLTIAYADLPLAYFALGAAGFLFLWLKGLAPQGSLALTAWFCAGLAWCKYEGPPLAGTVVLAAALTLLWLRPPRLGRQLAALLFPLTGLVLGVLPWRLFAAYHHLEMGSDHILHFFPHQFWQALPQVLLGLVNPVFFGVLWPTAALALLVMGRTLFSTPRLFLALFLGGNLLALVLAYALAPCSTAEFPFYIRGTLDRLLLHLSPIAGLLVGEGWKESGSDRWSQNPFCRSTAV